MSEGIIYRFKENASRGAPLEITGPKKLIDEATFSKRGPLHSDAKAAPGQSILGRSYDGQGNITLDFGLNTNGIPYFHGPPHIRSRKTLEVIAQLDEFAHRHDAADPRITISLSPVETTYGPSRSFQDPLAEDSFSVSFERPHGDMAELAAGIQSGMVRAAKPLYLYESTDHSAGVYCTVVDDLGLNVTMGPWPEDERLIMAIDPAVSSPEGRINLVGVQDRSSEERLVGLLGIIYALDPIVSPES